MNKTATGKRAVLIHEYRRAIEDFKQSIATLSEGEFSSIADRDTLNPSCVSIQSVVGHVVYCGNMYVDFIRQHRGEESALARKEVHQSPADYLHLLDEIADRTDQLFAELSEVEMMELDPEKKLQVYWGVVYDYEQLTEHAIVHVLRHRRMIERFLESFRSTV